MVDHRLPFHALEVKEPGALARAFGLRFLVVPTEPALHAVAGAAALLALLQRALACTGGASVAQFALVVAVVVPTLILAAPAIVGALEGVLSTVVNALVASAPVPGAGQ